MNARRPVSLLALALAVLVGLLHAAPARAQDVLGAGTPGEGNRPAHAWLVLKQEKEGDCAVVHLPPREAVRDDGKVHGAPAGTVRVAARIKATPERIAAIGPEVYLLFAPTPGAHAREVWSLGARSAGIGDLWRYEPDGRLRPQPALSTSFEPELFLGAGGHLFVLARDPSNSPVFMALHDDAWASLTLPDDVAAAVRMGFRTIEAWEVPGGFVLSIGKGDATLAWRATFSPSQRTPPAIAWQALPAGSASGNERGGQLASGPITIRWSQEDAEVNFQAAVGLSFVPLAELAGVSEHVAVVPAGAGRIIAAWSEPIPPDPRVREPKQRYKLSLAEISPNTGQVLYLGAPKGASPISADQFRFMVLGMVALTAAVLIFVLRSSGRDQEVHLDPDMSLAEPGRRIVAFAADILIALIAAARILNVDLAAILEPETLLLAGGPLVLLTLAIGFGFSTIGEWGLGRSPGKFLTRTEVVRLVRSPGAGPATARISLWQALVRNLIKWGLPPVSGIALIDPTGRHQGERLTRTAVVVRSEPEAPDA
jgi:hypothetical protein